MVISSVCIEGGEMFAFEEKEACFVRLKVKRDGEVQSLDFPIAHGTFDLIKKKFGVKGEEARGMQLARGIRHKCLMPDA